MTTSVDIKDISGNTIHSVSISEQCITHDELMKAFYAKLSWNTDVNETLPEGTYIVVSGIRYSLLEPYSPTQKDEATFLYEPEFQHPIMIWDKKELFFYQRDDSGIVIGREISWTITDTPSNIMAYIAEAIKEETGVEYTISVDSSLTASVTLQFKSTSIFSALSDLADNCKTEWWAKDGVLHLSKCSWGEPITLEVGVNIQTPSVTKNKDGYFTRFYAYGSTRNITNDYNSGSTTNHIVEKRLALNKTVYPDGYKDIRPNLKQEEVFVKTLIFDNVYPRSFLNISDVRNELKYTLDGNGNKVQIGTDGEGNPIYDMYAIWYFKVPGFTFTDDLIIEGKNLSVNFQSGQLQDKEFELKYHSDTQEYEIIFDESTGTIIPGTTALIPSDGDNIVLFNINMPQEYVTAAENELGEELEAEISLRLSDRNTYQFKSDPTAFEENATDVNVGQLVTYVNGGYSYITRVLSVEKQMDSPIEQNITIGEENVKGNQQELKETVTNVNKDVNIIKALNDLSTNIQNAYGRAQKQVAEALSEWGKMWEWDKSLDTTPDKVDTSKWSIKTTFGISTDQFLSSKGSNRGTGSEPGELTTLGALNNVGSWADEVPAVDRVMYQAAGSSHWSSKNLAEIFGLSKVTVKLGNVSYDSVDGTVYLPAYPTSLPASDVYSWAKQSSKPSYIWDEIGNKPSTFTPSAHTHSWSDIVSGKPTTLSGYGITDAFSVVPVGSGNISLSGFQGGYWGGIGSYASFVQNGYGGQLQFDGTGVSQRYINGGGEYYSWRKLLDSVNFKDVTDSRYVLKSGDTISGRLTVNYNDVYPFRLIGAAQYNVIDFQDVNHLSVANMGWLNDSRGNLVYLANSSSPSGIFVSSNNPYYTNDLNILTKYKIWHEGNDGVDSGLDADTVDGAHNGNLAARYIKADNYTNDLNNPLWMGDQWGITLNYYDNGALNKPVGANNANMLINLDFSHHGTSGPYGAQFAIPNNSRLYYRTWVAGSPFSDWQSIAFVTDNVASATKLQTPRYIYGQYFDGQQNVNGTLYVEGNNGNYGEGIRIKPYQGWTTLLLGGTDLSANQGTSPNTWSMHNNDGSFYLTRNLQNNASSYINNINNRWRIGVDESVSPYINALKLLNYNNNPYGLHFGIRNNGNSILQSGRDNATVLDTPPTEAFGLELQPFGGNVSIGSTDTSTYKLFVNGTIANNNSITSPYTTLRGTLINNAYNGLGLEVRGDGSANIIKPGIGFHQPGLYAGFINMSNATNFDFWQYAGLHGNACANDFLADGWFRSQGNYGWYNESYGGGIYMEDTTWVRVYNGKSFYVPNEIYAAVGVWTDGYLSGKGQNTTSDITKKNILKDTIIAVKDIARAPSFEFTWKDGFGGLEIGTSAQYWQKVLPSSVKEFRGALTLNYGAVALLSSIAIAKKVVNHEDRIKALEKENKQLKKEISNLERRLYA